MHDSSSLWLIHAHGEPLDLKRSLLHALIELVAEVEALDGPREFAQLILSLVPQHSLLYWTPV